MQVWYHGEWCKTRGRNCWNTNLVDDKGCCIWYNELQVRFQLSDFPTVTQF